MLDEGVKVAGSFVDALKREPLSLALCLMNIALLVFFYMLLTLDSVQRERDLSLLYADKKEVRELLVRCVVPPRQGGQN